MISSNTNLNVWKKNETYNLNKTNKPQLCKGISTNLDMLYGNKAISDIIFTGMLPKEEILKRLNPSIEHLFKSYFDSVDVKIPEMLKITISSAEKLKKYITNNAKDPKDFIKNICKNNQIVMLGEKHDYMEAKKFATEILQTFKDNGYSNIGIEIDNKYQKDIDAFMSDKLSIEELDNKLKTIPAIPEEILKVLPENISKPMFVNTGSYLNQSCSTAFLKECKKQGLKVFCLDNTDGFLWSFWKTQLDSDYSSHMNSQYDRDKRMFANFKTHIWDTDPNSKTLIYIGNMHTKKAKLGNTDNISLRMLLDKYTTSNIASITIANPHEINGVIKLDKIPGNIAFSTHSNELNDIVNQLHGDVSYENGYEYYNKHMDGIIVLK